MTEAKLTQTRIIAGFWHGVLTGPLAMPRLEVLHLENPVPGLVVIETPGKPGQWEVRVPIPTQALSDGVQTFVIRDAATLETMAHFTVITGMAMEEDIRAELDLLRAELDLLKRAFRRHCVETAG